MYKKYLASCTNSKLKKAYSLYLNVYTDWGSSNPLNFDEFKDSYAKQSDFEPTFAFFDEKDFIGYGCIMGNYPQHKRLEIGYSVAKTKRKKGYGNKICKELISLSINKFNPSLILADVFGKNIPSEKILIKNGFKKAGVIPSYNHSLDYPRNLTTYFLKNENKS